MEFRAIIDLLDMLGAFARRILTGSKIQVNEEFRTRDNTLLGLGTLAALACLALFLFAC